MFEIYKVEVCQGRGLYRCAGGKATKVYIIIKRVKGDKEWPQQKLQRNIIWGCLK